MILAHTNLADIPQSLANTPTTAYPFQEKKGIKPETYHSATHIDSSHLSSIIPSYKYPLQHPNNFTYLICTGAQVEGYNLGNIKIPTLGSYK